MARLASGDGLRPECLLPDLGERIIPSVHPNTSLPTFPFRSWKFRSSLRSRTNAFERGSIQF